MLLFLAEWKRCSLSHIVSAYDLYHGCANHDTEGKLIKSPIHCCDITKPPYLFSGELCTSTLDYKLLFVYNVCCRRTGQCFSVLRTRHTDVVDRSSGRSYITEQWHNVPLLRTRDLDHGMKNSSIHYYYHSHLQLQAMFIDLTTLQNTKSVVRLHETYIAELNYTDWLILILRLFTNR